MRSCACHRPHLVFCMCSSASGVWQCRCLCLCFFLLQLGFGSFYVCNWAETQTQSRNLSRTHARLQTWAQTQTEPRPSGSIPKHKHTSTCTNNRHKQTSNTRIQVGGGDKRKRASTHDTTLMDASGFRGGVRVLTEGARFLSDGAIRHGPRTPKHRLPPDPCTTGLLRAGSLCCSGLWFRGDPNGQHVFSSHFGSSAISPHRAFDSNICLAPSWVSSGSRHSRFKRNHCDLGLSRAGLFDMSRWTPGSFSAAPMLGLRVALGASRLEVVGDGVAQQSPCTAASRRDRLVVLGLRRTSIAPTLPFAVVPSALVRADICSSL